jgi:hypothetical protein
MNSVKTSENYNVTGAAPEPLALEVPHECAGRRLDQTLSHLLPEFSRSRLAQWIRDGRVEINGQSALPKSRVWGGEKIVVRRTAEPATTAAAPESIALDVVHEDDQVLVINKPAGLVVHPGPACPCAAARVNPACRHSASSRQGNQRPAGRSPDSGGANQSGAPVTSAHRKARISRPRAWRNHPCRPDRGAYRQTSGATHAHGGGRARQAGHHAFRSAEAFHARHFTAMPARNRPHASDSCPLAIAGSPVSR